MYSSQNDIDHAILTKNPNLLLPDFANISYLQHGSALQQEIYHLIHDKKILYHLKPIWPVLAGTLPLNLFIEGKSDLDILGEATDLKIVEKILLTNFSDYDGFITEEKIIQRQPTLLCRFSIHSIPFEVFVQNVPVKQQYGYRHMVIEYWLLAKHGADLGLRILELKQSGLKTEPAFAHALQLKGNPYEALLEFERDAEFKNYISAKA